MNRLVGGGLAAAVVGALALALGLALNPRQALVSYLAAWAFAVSVALGALLLLMIGHAARSAWFVVFRRATEAIVGTLPLLAVLFVPVALGLRRIYPWASPETLHNPVLLHAIAAKARWLNPGAFAVRSVLYLVLCMAVGETLLTLSHRSDRAPGGDAPALQRAISAAGLPLIGLVGTFAAFDWLMSLDPGWYSTVFGVYFLCGGFLGAVALVIVVAVAARRAGVLPPEVGVGHFHALGKLLLTSVAFWAYIAFVQFLIIWIADLPEEVGWFVTRSSRGWGLVAVALVLGKFIVPFFALLQRAVTRVPGRLWWVAAWLLVAHYLDIYWLVLPSVHPSTVRVHWLDAGALLAVGGALLAVGAWRFAHSTPLPLHDPDLAAGLAYRS